MPVRVKTGGPPTTSSKCSKTRRPFWAMTAVRRLRIVLADDGPRLAAGPGAKVRLFQKTTRPARARARAKAMLVPITPPPTMRMSQVTAIGNPVERMNAER